MPRMLVAIGLVLVLAAVALPARPSAKGPARCPVTPPQTVPPPDTSGFGPEAFNYGGTKLRAHLWPRGILFVGELPGGGFYATMQADGAIHAKVGWWRGVPGRLAITGRRLDGPAPPLRANVPPGYGRTGFQPVGLLFPAMGCWRVVGAVRDVRLAFVVKVRPAPRG
jgi:hypothetical protein